MTMPHLMNCPHLGDGWCLDCVGAQHNELERYRTRDAARKPLSDAQIADLWRATFSTQNPYCPCDIRSFAKAARAAEYAHGITP